MGKLAELLHFRKEEEKEKETRYILTIDGGGMRGIIPARVISHLSQMLKEMGDERPFYSHFDLIAGTSTGGFLAAGLSCPRECSNLEADDAEETMVSHMEKDGGFFRRTYRTVEDGMIQRAPDPEMLEKLYSEEGWRIFQKPPLSLFGPIFQDKYDYRNLERFLYETFGDTGIDELLTPTAMISYETKSGSPYVFRSYDDHGFKLREALRATSAAPTYFAPVELSDRLTGEKIVCIDGGVGANNPSMLAYLEAKKLYPEADEFRMLSLSTGKGPYSFDPTKSGGGFTGWASSITKVYSTAQETLSRIYADAMPDMKILRVFSNELEKRISLDDVSRESIAMLEDAGEKVFLNQEDEIRAFATELSSSPTHIDAVRLRTRETPLLSDADSPSSSSDSSSILPN